MMGASAWCDKCGKEGTNQEIKTCRLDFDDVWTGEPIENDEGTLITASDLCFDCIAGLKSLWLKYVSEKKGRAAIE